MTLLRSRRPKNPLQNTQFNQGKSITLPSPSGGINLRDDIGDMKPNEARVLENWLPTTGQMSFRPGKTHHAAGMGTGEVKTLAAFVGYSSSAMLAAANGKIYDVSSTTYDDSSRAESAAVPGNDSYTKILLKFDGADASTTITDSNAGGSAHTWTAAGNAQIDTADSKFGGASLLCDGTGDIVSATDSSDFTLGSGNWTVDCWFKCNAAGGTVKYLCGQADAGISAAGSSFHIQRNASNVIVASVSTGSAFVTVTGTTTYTDALHTGWHHMALVRTGDILRLFLDGTQEGGDIAFTGSVNDASGVFVVGGANAAATTPWLGWVDEFRLSVGTARWTAAFTAPLVPYAPKELASGFTNDLWQTALYSNRLQFVNGSDTPQVYDGSTVSAIAWSGSGLTNTNLVNVALVRNRLWFCETGQAWVWYGAIGQVTAASALTKFDLSQIAGGGYCMAAASWSRDGGNGADDLTVFVMSTGELIIYQGDPATTFTLIGKFYGAPPIGRQCTFKVGGELVVITAQGLLPVSTAIGGTVTAQDISAIDPWGKIAPGIAADAVLDRDNTGWSGLFHLGLVYVNVPQTPGILSKQWVLNTRNGSFTNFTGMNGSAWCSFSGALYFGTMTGGVMSNAGGSDDGAVITAVANCSFVYPNKTQANNLFTAARPKIKAEGSVTGFVGVDVDFDIRSLAGATVDFSSAATASAWNTSPWNDTPWGHGADAIQLWYTINGMGKAVSVRLTASARSTDVQWFATDLLYKPGGIK